MAATYKQKNAELASEALYVEAVVKLQVLNDYPASAEVFQRIVSEFPNTQSAPRAAQLLDTINQRIQAEKVAAAMKPGIAFPDFSEKDLSGAPLSLGKFKGKYVLVDFWATWCGPCMREMPNVVAAYKKYHPKGFEIVGISLDQDQGTLEGVIGAKGIVWPQYFDGRGWENKLSSRYGVSSIPATYLLDRDGKIIAKDLRGEDLEKKLSELLGE